MRTLIFGKNGQISWELERSLAVLGEVCCVGSAEVDFLSPDSIRKVIREYQPSHIVNAAAYTAVDKAESEESAAAVINGDSVGVVAEEAKKIGSVFLHYSTDYVFDGTKASPYIETDATAPLNAYGRSKLLGEKLVQEVDGNYIILRVSWVYGARGNNFYRTMLRLGSEREELGIVADQVGTPTWSRHIAEASAHILTDATVLDKKGLYHLSPSGDTSWFGFASKIFELHRKYKPEIPLKVRTVKPINTSDYPTPARRPLNSRMNADKVYHAFGVKLPSWDQSLDMVLRG